jgi:putative ABC transport system permease protein
MPDFKAEIRARLAELRLPPVREAEIAEEFSQHLTDQYEAAINRGDSEEEARHAVFQELNEFVNRELKRVERRDLAQDLRFALRTLVKNPGFTIVAVIALALGIGANSAIFSVVNAILLRPLPYKSPDQLVVIWENAAHLGFPKDTPSPANFLDWRGQSTVFAGMSAFAERSFNLTGVGEPERLEGRRVSANLFDVLGVKPIIGRSFVAQEDQPGSKVVLLNESLWKRRFGSAR